MNDSDIIELFFERSEEAIIELSKKYGRLCLNIVKNITNNDQTLNEFLTANIKQDRNKKAVIEISFTPITQLSDYFSKSMSLFYYLSKYLE